MSLLLRRVFLLVLVCPRIWKPRGIAQEGVWSYEGEGGAKSCHADDTRKYEH